MALLYLHTYFGQDKKKINKKNNISEIENLNFFIEIIKQKRYNQATNAKFFLILQVIRIPTDTVLINNNNDKIYNNRNNLFQHTQ